MKKQLRVISINNGSISIKEDKDGLPVCEVTLKIKAESMKEASEFVSQTRKCPGDLTFESRQLSMGDKLNSR
jgi:hypothetical protein